MGNFRPRNIPDVQVNEGVEVQNFYSIIPHVMKLRLAKGFGPGA
jgi:hypothetical protein